MAIKISVSVCVKEGDKNTKNFHRLANSHHCNNTIGKLVVEGDEITNLAAIKEKIVNSYEALFSVLGI